MIGEALIEAIDDDGYLLAGLDDIQAALAPEHRRPNRPKSRPCCT